MTSDFDSDRKVESNSSEAWKRYLKNYFGESLHEIKCFDNDMIIQKKNHWDWLLIFDGEERPLRIDIKTRTEKYHKFYQRDKKILIETIGNVERNDLGSSIYNSNADLWSYGFFVGGEIVDAVIYQRKLLADWLKQTESYFTKPKLASTQNLYHTENVLIDRVFLKPFEWRARRK